MRPGEAENVTTYLRFLEAASRRRELELTSLCTEDVRLLTPLTDIWRVELSGHEGIVAWVRRMNEEWAFLDATPRDWEDRDDDWVLGHALMRGRGKASPTEIEFEIHHAVHFSNGLLDEFNAFLAVEQAIERVEQSRQLASVDSD